MRKFDISLLVFFIVISVSSLSFISSSQNTQLSEDLQNVIQNYLARAEEYEKSDNIREAAAYINKVAYLYWQNGISKDAIKYFQKSLSLNNETGNQNAVRTIYNNLGFIYSEYGDYHSAINYFTENLKICRSLNRKEGTATALINISEALFELKEYNKLNEKLFKALDLAKEINNFQIIKSCYELLYKNYEKLGDSEKSGEYFELYLSLQKHLQKKKLESLEIKTRQAEARAIAKERLLISAKDTLNEMVKINREMQLQNQLLNREKAIKELALKEEQARRNELEALAKARRIMLLFVIIALSSVTFIMVLVYFQFSQKKKANALLEEQKIEIEKQRDLANIQKKKLTDSIQYAKRIQNAILPPTELLDNLMQDYFVLYRPRDIVSGDFYWITNKSNILILAAADCTGHGVPGAFMSMLGVAFLNEIVNKIVINKHISSLQADEILNELRKNVIHSLHQTGRHDEPKDGMDMALCIIDYNENTLQFAGARNPLYLIQNGELAQYNADKMSVSYSQRINRPFTKHNVKLNIGDVLYIFSDGYIDQFGGDHGMKYKTKSLKELLLSIYHKPMCEQKEILIKKHEEWKGGRNQLDDILIFGLRYTERKKISTEQQYNWINKNILVAEDTDVNYFFLEEVLKPTNAHLVRVNNGKEAIEFCKSNNVDLILMDINMPAMNGYEATRSIKDYNSNIPIIVQTAAGFNNEEELSINAGADDYIAKPIDLKTFMTKLEKFLG
jgi:CheY-like chemotaxis protein